VKLFFGKIASLKNWIRGMKLRSNYCAQIGEENIGDIVEVFKR